MRVARTATAALLAVLGLAATGIAEGASAQVSGRDNPFAAPPTSLEEQMRQEDRIRQIIRDMIPEIERKLMEKVTSAQVAAEVRLRKRIDEVANGQGAKPGTGRPGGPSKPGQPSTARNGADGNEADGAKFISCVNGKALYRDKDNALFQVAGSGVSGVDRCAR